jgi:hypothetical protein
MPATPWTTWHALGMTTAPFLTCRVCAPPPPPPSSPPSVSRSLQHRHKRDEKASACAINIYVVGHSQETLAADKSPSLCVFPHVPRGESLIKVEYMVDGGDESFLLYTGDPRVLDASGRSTIIGILDALRIGRLVDILNMGDLLISHIQDMCNCFGGMASGKAPAFTRGGFDPAYAMCFCCCSSGKTTCAFICAVYATDHAPRHPAMPLKVPQRCDTFLRYNCSRLPMRMHCL